MAQPQQPRQHYRKLPLRPFVKLNGVFYLANLWNELRSAFNLRTIPDVCITMGFPSRRARTRASNRAPGEILVEEWKGDNVEKALVSIHPERFHNVTQVALATLFIIGNEVYGSRRNLGSLSLGVDMNRETGDLGFTQDEKGQHAYSMVGAIVKRLGSVPEGFAEMPEPKQRAQANRQLKYTCQTCSTIIRSAGQALEVLCLHGGKPEHGQPGTPFVLQQPTQPQSQSTQAAANGGAAQPPVQKHESTSPAKASKASKTPSVPKVVARNFGAEASA